MSPWQSKDPRRAQPRITVDAFCTELDDQHFRHAQVIDLSESGLRIRRPVDGFWAPIVQLEFEIPGIDEVMWASGELRFDRSHWEPRLRTSGISLRAAASRHRRMLRDYVMDTWLSTEGPIDAMWPGRASCYLRG